MSPSTPPHHNTSSMLQDATNQPVRCKGVIKKLFPTKRYGFVVLECTEHEGEAHFNYSDLQLDETDRANLCIGWRLVFEVVRQDRPTAHCVYRAIQVYPVEVMVIQCELVEGQGDSLSFVSRELGNKSIYCHRASFNGKVEGTNSRETCRAAISWNQLRKPHPVASHCSQDTPNARDGRETPVQNRSLCYKTPERRTNRKEGGTAHSLHHGSAGGSSCTGVSNVNASAITISPSAINLGKGIGVHASSRLDKQHLNATGHSKRLLEDSGVLFSPEPMDTSLGSRSRVPTSTPKSDRRPQTWPNISPFIAADVKHKLSQIMSDRMQHQDSPFDEFHSCPSEQNFIENKCGNASPHSPRNLWCEFQASDHHRDVMTDGHRSSSKAGFLNETIPRLMSPLEGVPRTPRMTVPSPFGGFLTNDTRLPSMRNNLGAYDPGVDDIDTDALVRQVLQHSAGQRVNTSDFSTLLHERQPEPEYAAARNFATKTCMNDYLASRGESAGLWQRNPTAFDGLTPPAEHDSTMEDMRGLINQRHSVP